MLNPVISDPGFVVGFCSSTNPPSTIQHCMWYQYKCTFIHYPGRIPYTFNYSIRIYCTTSVGIRSAGAWKTRQIEKNGLQVIGRGYGGTLGVIGNFREISRWFREIFLGLEECVRSVCIKVIFWNVKSKYSQSVWRKIIPRSYPPTMHKCWTNVDIRFT